MISPNITHTPVLLKEAIKGLDVKPGRYYVDATFGGGGHTQEILKLNAHVIAIDQDEEAIKVEQIKINRKNLTLVHDNFLHLVDILNKINISNIAGILFDLGTSAIQLESQGRGFSFMRSETLDMRMSKTLTVTAKDLVNGLGKKELYALFTKYAQEKHARAIAKAIVSARRLGPINTTKELADIVLNVQHGRRGKIHPATKVFQALRIAVNDELNNLKEVLPQAFQELSVGGRMVIISFHEGEDRIVKTFFKQLKQDRLATIITKKPITPRHHETTQNHKARSAKLRICEKIK